MLIPENAQWQYLAGSHPVSTNWLHPRFEDLTAKLGGRRRLAAVILILLVLLVIVLPLVGLISLVTAQALRVTQAVTPWAQRMIEQPDRFTDWIESQPLFRHVLPYEDEILRRIAELVRWISSWAVDNLSAATAGNYVDVVGAWAGRRVLGVYPPGLAVRIIEACQLVRADLFFNLVLTNSKR